MALFSPELAEEQIVRYTPAPIFHLHIKSALSCYAAAKLRLRGTSVLVEMRLENYAVIDNLVVEFGQGLNLLTGETGAGKSILIDALALLLGEKASSDVIRAGTQRAVVSAVLEAEGTAEKQLAAVLE